jgi:multicomponent Na+:H+ antiporter subunit D
VALTVFAGPLLKVADGSAGIMLDRSAYIHSVLGDSVEVPPLAQTDEPRTGEAPSVETQPGDAK